MTFERLGYDEIAGWEADDHAKALAVFRRQCLGSSSGSEKQRGRFGVNPQRLLELCREAAAVPVDDRSAARRFFEASFVPLRIASPGFVTGYFEPEFEGALKRSAHFDVPLYRRPPDLLPLTPENRPQSMDKSLAFARRLPDGTLVEYPDRGAIMDGALDGRGLELIWLADPVDAFYVHVQGSARIRLRDGGVMRVGYAGKTGHPYFPIGRVMIERGLAAPGTVTMDVLRRWLAENPHEVDSVLRRNRSFIFFREIDADPDRGPVGAAGLPLVSGRSLAVDRTLHTFGTPVFVSADLPIDQSGEPKPFNRLMIADDSGSAIIGPARGDIFVGSGVEAGQIAGAMQHAATFILLVPKGEALSGEGVQ